MHHKRPGATRPSILLAAALFAALSGSTAGSGQSLSMSAAPKTAGQVYKNLHVLQDMPADQLYATMHFIDASLGVECDHCHVNRDFDKDDKQAKRTARKMMQMELAINRDHFQGNTVVTCNSCHRGALAPMGTPILVEDPGKPAPAVSPAAEQLMDRYVQALGGADAIQRIASRSEQTTITLVSVEGRQFPFEILAKGPDKLLQVTHRPEGDGFTAYDGHLAWTKGPGGVASDMSPAAADYFKFDADLHLPLHLKQMFTRLQVGPTEVIGGRRARAVIGLHEGQPPVTFYFDEGSGLLLRMVRFTSTPLGPNPWQIDYTDYRDQGGVKIPFHRSYFQSDFRYTIDVHQVRLNVAIDDSRFAKPN